jgi:hypothetical protein
LFGTFRTSGHVGYQVLSGHVGYQVLSGHRRDWFDMRDLGAVLDHEEPHPACDQAR